MFINAREGQRARVTLVHPITAGTGLTQAIEGEVMMYWLDGYGVPSAIVVGRERRVVIPWHNVASITDPEDLESSERGGTADAPA